jgi:hypothetical protein
MEYPQRPDASTWRVGGKVYNESYSRCKYRYTRLLAPEHATKLVPEEEDLKWAAEETQGAICSVLLTIGFGVEQTWAELFAHSPGGDRVTEPQAVETRVRAWEDALAQLMAWLGWESGLLGCKEVCAFDERCFIPMWPLIGRPNFGRGRPRNGTGPGGPRPPYGYPRFPPNGTGPGRPGFGGGLPRGPALMGDETDLWEPKCVKAGFM